MESRPSIKSRGEESIFSRFVEVTLGFFIWSVEVASYLSFVTFFIFQILFFQTFFDEFVFVMILSVASVFIPYISVGYVKIHEREFIELFAGQSDIASIVGVFADFARYVLLRILYYPSALALMMATGFSIPFILLSNKDSELLVPYRVVSRVFGYVQDKLLRFEQLDGPKLEKLPPEAPSVEHFLRGVDIWLERKLFPPIQLAIPLYMKIVVEEKSAEALLPEGEESTHMQLDVEVSMGDQIKCQICGQMVGDDHIRCSQCDTPHHEECWEWCGVCSTYGCGCLSFNKIS